MQGPSGTHQVNQAYPFTIAQTPHGSHAPPDTPSDSPELPNIPPPLPPLPPLHPTIKLIQEPTVEAPLNAKPLTQALSAYLTDKVLHYHALLLVNTTSEASKLLRHHLQHYRPTPLFAARIDQEILNENPNPLMCLYLHTIQHSHVLPFQSTLFLHFVHQRHNPSRKSRPTGSMVVRHNHTIEESTQLFEQQLHVLLQTTEVMRPDLKYVLAFEKGESYAKRNGCLHWDCLNMASYQWDFHQTLIERRASKALSRSPYRPPVSQSTVALLAQVSKEMMPRAIYDASVRIAQQSHALVDEQVWFESLRQAVHKINSWSSIQQHKGDWEYIMPFQMALPIYQGQQQLSQHFAGMAPAIHEFMTIIQNRQRLRKLIPNTLRTLLLYGPPGTGKTTLVRAIAAVTGFPLFAPRSSALINKYIGESANNVYKLFDGVRSYGKAHGTDVLVFIDEIDALLGARGHGGGGGEKEYGRVVNALLEKLQGISDDPSDPLIFIGATNLLERLDQAALDRFAFRIELPMPDVATLASILQFHLKDRQHRLSPQESLEWAESAKGLSGRHVVTCLNKAGLIAYLDHPHDLELQVITKQTLDKALRAFRAQSTEVAGMTWQQSSMYS